MLRLIGTLTILALVGIVAHAQERESANQQPFDIGNRWELFVDDRLLQKLDGQVRQEIRRPTPQEVVFVADAPWEGNTSGYYTVFRDGDLYRMIYRGWQHDQAKKAEHREVTCYAESVDGVEWIKPNLGLHEWNGSTENNIVWLGEGTHNFTAFRDNNPAAADSSRYKALGRGRGGLLAFESPDCKRWKLIRDQPVITNGAFDSQNLAFWDSVRGEYRAYWRFFTRKSDDPAAPPAGYRAIRTATSKDFVHWENEADLVYGDGTPTEHLYTNAIQPYFRAPHLMIGFPTRFLPNQGERTEPVLMSSRDGVHFERWSKAVIPEEAPADRKGNRSNYMTWGMFQLPGKPNEISVYATENYYEPTPGRVRRFVYRLDGFVALEADSVGGTVTTRPLRYHGSQLQLNYLTRPGGSLSVEVLDRSGNLIGRSQSLQGDAIDRPVAWQLDPELDEGIVQLRFKMKDCDLYSIRFHRPSAEPLGELSEAETLTLLVERIDRVQDPSVQIALMRGILSGLEGRRRVTPPKAWGELGERLSASNRPELRDLADQLSQLFGDDAAARRAMETLTDQAAPTPLRRAALRSLLGQQNRDVLKQLPALLDEPELRTDAIRGYAEIESTQASEVLLARYAEWNPETRRAVVETLASRENYARELLKAIRNGGVSREEIPAHVARSLDQIFGAKFRQVFGNIRQLDQDRQHLMTKYKSMISDEALAKADASRGRAVFEKTCASCHRLYDSGGEIGPDLTGSNRANLDYILLNSVDPSYDVPEGYRMVLIQTVDGRLVSGVIAEENSQRVVLKTVEQPRVIIAKEDIAARKVSEKSMMPDGQLEQMSRQQIVDLILYLRTTEQVEMPK